MASWLPNWPDWPNTPIPGVSLSAGGLLALADLSTIAQRTAITGGSSWLDSLLLAPGLHYQQAVEELASRGSTSTTGGVGSSNDEDYHVEECDHTGTPVRRFRIRNTATKMYIRRIARPGETVTLDVGAALPATRMSMGARYQMPKPDGGIHVTDWAVDSVAAEHGQDKDDKADDCHGGHTGSVSHFLYLASPVLTIIALACVVLVKDWWAFGQLGGLMLSRILNIWIIKQRTKGQDDQQSSGSFEPSLTTYNIPLATSHPNEAPTSVRLRGRPSDLRAITSSSWLRAKTHGQGYLEATAKLVVYAVAAFSGNATQIGAIIMMGLLLSTAALLALSNSHAKCLTVCGRVVVSKDSGASGKNSGNGKGGIKREGSKESAEKRVRFMFSAPSSASTGTSSAGEVDDREGPRVFEGQEVPTENEEAAGNEGMEDIKL
ncbi:hypothetical protein V8F33_001148 [Rhypophila sp. PSN 637]